MLPVGGSIDAVACHVSFAQITCSDLLVEGKILILFVAFSNR